MKKNLILLGTFLLALSSCGVSSQTSISQDSLPVSSSKAAATHTENVMDARLNDYFAIQVKPVTESEGNRYILVVSFTVSAFLSSFVSYQGSGIVTFNLLRNDATTYPTNLVKEVPVTFDKFGSATGSFEEASQDSFQRDISINWDFSSIKFTSGHCSVTYFNYGVSGDESLTYKSFALTEYNFSTYFALSASQWGSVNQKVVVTPTSKNPLLDYRDVHVVFNTQEETILHRDGSYSDFVAADKSVVLKVVTVTGTIDQYPGKTL
jgi:hypothetical protein